MISGWPQCVPNPPSCDQFRCQDGTVCKIVDYRPGVLLSHHPATEHIVKEGLFVRPSVACQLVYPFCLPVTKLTVPREWCARLHMAGQHVFQQQHLLALLYIVKWGLCVGLLMDSPNVCTTHLPVTNSAAVWGLSVRL